MTTETPRNVVQNPILNSPFFEPNRFYDFTGPLPEVRSGRRAAGYHGVARTDRMGGASIASGEFFPLDTVNDIRSRVRSWREGGYQGVTSVTRDLLDHWNDPDRRPMFYCQREAVETVIWLLESSPAQRQGVDIPADVPADLDSLRKKYGPLRRYLTKMATGSGKTIVMAMVATWSILNKVSKSRIHSETSDSILVVCPNLTVRERLSVLIPQQQGNYYDQFDLVPPGYRDLLSKGRVFVTNWHAFGVQDDSGRLGIVQRGREGDAAFVKRVIGTELGTSGQILVLNDEAHHAYRPAPPSEGEEEGLSADEKREVESLAEEATVWVSGLDRINKVRGIRFILDVSATPFHLKGSGQPEGSPFPWIVSDFGLVDAIESGITKVPRIPVGDDSGRPDPKYFHLWRAIMAKLPPADRGTAKRPPKPEAVWREAQGALTTLAEKWDDTQRYFIECGYEVPPAMIVVAQNTKIASVVAEAVSRGDVLDGLKGGNTFEINSDVLAKAEAADPGSTKDRAQELLRLTTATVGKARWPDRPPEGFEDLVEPPGRWKRCIVSVGMLTEGWDAQNVTQILGLRAFTSQLLCEQVVGRGLRRMNYDSFERIDVEGRTIEVLTPEYCDVFGVPFEIIPVQGSKTTGPKPEPPPSTLVKALEDRKALVIEFPRVEGFVMDVRDRIRCDVAAIPALRIEPQVEPTSVLVRTQMGWVVAKAGIQSTSGAVETVTREEFYREHRLQKTAFGIARDITEVLGGGKVTAGKDQRVEKPREWARLLFPQVLAATEDYLNTRVDVAPTAQIEEVALAKYRDVVVERLLNGIEPENQNGEPALLPRVERHRPLGSTAEVQFRTTRRVIGTIKSHVSHVVLDSSWEGAAKFHLESLPEVLSFVKNDGLHFDILYEWEARPHRYRPDFLVRVAMPSGEIVTLILEVKGMEAEKDRTKWSSTAKWIRAVNHHGGYGQWAHIVCKAPNDIGEDIKAWRSGSARNGAV